MGQAAIRLDELVQRAADATRAAGAKQARARADAVRVIRAMEAKLRLALDGSPLKGLANLAGRVPEIPPFQAARVRSGDSRFGIDEFLPANGRAVLVLTKDGYLSMAALGRHEVRSVYVEDDELIVQDLEPVAETIRCALERHIERSLKSETSYDKAMLLSRKLAGAIGFAL